MARLGAVLGGIFAELTRARVSADSLTRDLADEYRHDPLLSNLSIPRIALGDVDITLRFVVEDVEEVAVEPPDLRDVLDGWRSEYANVLGDWLGARGGLSKREVRVVLGRLADADERAEGEAVPRVRRMPLNVPQNQVKAALGGNSEAMTNASTKFVVDRFEALPGQLRTRLGSKPRFQRELAVATQRALDGFIARRVELQNAKSHLLSKLDVSVARGDVSAEPAANQEIRLRLRGDDLDVIFGAGGDE